MGLFSSKKKTYVSSVAYNLGGDEEDQPDFLKYTALQAIMQNRSVGESISHAYLTGQGLKLRNLYNYALNKYPNGLPGSSAVYLDRPDLTALTAVLQTLHQQAEILYVTTYIGTADYQWWAEQFLAKEYGYDRTLQEFLRPPEGVETTAEVTYDLEPNGRIQILLTNADGHVTTVDFRPSGVRLTKTYVHSCYQTRQTFQKETKTVVRPAVVGDVDTVSITLEEVVRVGEIQQTWTRVTTDVNAEGTETTIVTEGTVTKTSRPRYFLYLMGSGVYPTLDTIADPADLASPYYPTIPLRVNNVDYTDEAHQQTELYKSSKKMLDKVNVDLGELAESVASNEQINDIDYAFVVFGVCLNTSSQCGKRYLFEFFEYLRTLSVYTSDDQATWEGSAERNQVPPKINMLEIFNPKKRADDYDIRIQWQYVDTTIKSGLAFPGAKIGDVDISSSGIQVDFQFLFNDIHLDSSKLYARRQITETSYEELEICGLTYDNFIYKGKAVSYTAYEAMSDEDDGNAFIIPLNQVLLRNLGIKDMTQLAFEAAHIVFNCYKVVKQKWYQTSLFKIIIVIIAIIVVVFTWGAATPAATGMVGAAFAVAAALGATGILLTYLAATLYVLAMMVLSSIISKVAVDVFGPKWGAIIGAIVSILAMNWASTGSVMGSFASVGTTGVTANMILQGTMAASNIYGGYVNGQLATMSQDMQELQDQYDTKLDELEKLTKEFLSPGTNLLDIGGYIDSSSQFLFESSSTFLTRTLLLGSDIVAITSGLIENFTEVGLSLDLDTIG